MNADFDERALTWDDDPEHRDRAVQAARLVRGAVPLEETTRVLEYGAGTGLLSAELAGEVGHVIVTDPSAGMRSVLLAKQANGEFGSAQVLDLDLARDPAPSLEVEVVTALLSLHHVPSLGAVLQGFAELLVPGGWLAILDLEEEDGSFHGEGFDGHHGFERAALTRSLEAAGFASVAFHPGPVIHRDGRDYGTFLCTALRRDP